MNASMIQITHEAYLDFQREMARLRDENARLLAALEHAIAELWITLSRVDRPDTTEADARMACGRDGMD